MKKKFSFLTLKVNLIYKLGVFSIFRYYIYIFKKKLLFVFPSLSSSNILVCFDFFRVDSNISKDFSSLSVVDIPPYKYFGWKEVSAHEIPNWFANCISGSALSCSNRPWWRIDDFGNEAGDIKCIWEPSRFDWLVNFSQIAVSKDSSYISTINTWLSDWVMNNPAYLGPNWKCGQEASLRVINLVLAVNVLGKLDECSSGIINIVLIHLERISFSTGYAIAQNNNHGTSEGLALFVGGTLLLRNDNPKGLAFAEKGRAILENRVRTLILKDGTFSQYSTIYHRMVLDTLSFAEYIRIKTGGRPFSNVFYKNVKLSIYWLYSMPGIEFGDVVNLGSNDGSHIINLTGCDYRDCRPSLQLASNLFLRKSLFEPGSFIDQQLHTLGLKPSNYVISPSTSTLFDSGGFLVLRMSHISVLLRYPRFKFRPSQCDLLHLDLWIGSKNVLPDSGTYTYSPSDTEVDFSGVEYHNTIQFDNRQQMPRVGRFMYAAWPNANVHKFLLSSSESNEFSASYKDFLGATHTRTVILSKSSLKVIDRIAGFTSQAILRWRLNDDFQLLGRGGTGSLVDVNVVSDVDFDIKLVKSHISKYYYERSEISVLEIIVNEPCEISTEFIFK